MYALEINNLCKKYKNGVTALNDVSLSVAEGDFFALLGPNGAGKSTTIGIITSLVNKTSGSVKIFGVDIDKNFQHAKSMLGVVPQEFNFNEFRKVREVLICQAGFYGIPYREAKKRADKYLTLLELFDKREETVRSLSGGMKRRLMIARAMLHEPRMLILDEPTAGVDIEIRRTMWNFLQELNHQGVTIILTTHYLEEAENLCRHIAIINHGRVIEHSTLPALLRQLDKEHFILYLEQPCSVSPHLNDYKISPISNLEIDVEIPQNGSVTELIQLLLEKGIQVRSMRNKANRLEEMFLRLTQQNQKEIE